MSIDMGARIVQWSVFGPSAAYGARRGVIFRNIKHHRTDSASSNSKENKFGEDGIE